MARKDQVRMRVWSWGVAIFTVIGLGPRSIAFDGQFIYVTSSSLKSLLKLGSGKKGTIKGLVYTSEDLESGWLVYADGLLVHCTTNDRGAFCRRIDRNTLKASFYWL